MSGDDLLAERYRGIRPAFGYPACPDHTRKATLFELLDARSAGIDLTEHFAMTPAASVSGLYFAHPAARYFNVGRLGSAVAPFLVGSMAQTHGFGVAFSMLAGALLIGATTWIWLPETRGRSVTA